MIGGFVSEVTPMASFKRLTVDGVAGTSEADDQIFVDVEAGADVRLGDAVWWQSSSVFVSRSDRRGKPLFVDRAVAKIGYSHGHRHKAVAS